MIFLTVVPTYNSEEFLNETLASVEAQDARDVTWRIHIQDGGSTDSTIDIIRAFSSRMEALHPTKNVAVTYDSAEDNGMYDAIQKGLNQLRKYSIGSNVFFWLNSDDLLCEGALKNLDMAFRNEEVEWVIGRAVDVDARGVEIKNDEHQRIEVQKLTSGDFNYTGGAWLRAESTAARLRCIDSSKLFTPGIRLAGDFELFTNLATQRLPTYVNFGVRAFRRHGNQLSVSAKLYQYERARILLQRQYFQPSSKTCDDGSSENGRVGIRTNYKTQIIYYPDYTAGNSYQELLYQRINAKGLTRVDQLEELAASSIQYAVHIHWLNQLIVADRDRSIANIHRFRNALEKIKREGARIIFTLHNISEHESTQSDLEEDLIGYMFRISNVVHVHHPIVCAEILERYGIFPWGKVVVAEHGPYPMPSNLNNIDLWDAFNVNSLDRQYIVIPGQIRQYKNLEFIYEILKALHTRRIIPSTWKVLFAGTIHPDVDRSTVERLGALDEVAIAKFRLSDDEFSRLIYNSAFTFLSYRSISTSGSLFHGLSMASPVVAPALGTIPAYVMNMKNGHLYAQGDVESAVSAIASIVALAVGGGAEYELLRSNAARTMAEAAWHATLDKIMMAASIE